MRILLGCILTMLFLFVACDQAETTAEPPGKSEERVINVIVETVAPATIRDVLALPGETLAWLEVKIPSDIAGKVEWMGADEGDSVREGQLLAKVDADALKAALDRAKASDELAKALFERRERLFQKKIVTQEEYDRALTEKTLAASSLRQAEVEYERGFVRSPMNGFVNTRPVEPGEFIQRGQTLMEVVNIDRIKVRVRVPEMDIRYLETGARALVSVDALSGKEFPGMISFVSFKADPATKTFAVDVAVENPEKIVRPGMIARVLFLRRMIETP